MPNNNPEYEDPEVVDRARVVNPVTLFPAWDSQAEIDRQPSPAERYAEMFRPGVEPEEAEASTKTPTPEPPKSGEKNFKP